MASLVLGPKMYAALMHNLYGFRRLKLNRKLDQIIRRGANIEIRLEQQMVEEFILDINYFVRMRYDENPFKDRQIENKDRTTVPALRFSVAEWKDLVTRFSLFEASNLNPEGRYSVPDIWFIIKQWRPDLQNLFQRLVVMSNQLETIS